jgi:Protein of unknown function (DUF1524)/Excalibur calcium-binding domain
VRRLTENAHGARWTVAVALLAAGLTGCGGAGTPAGSAVGPTADTMARPTTRPTVPSGGAAALLATLAIKGRAPMTGYSRDQFGQAWADVDRNGCDTRNDVLRRDLTGLSLRPGTHDCVVDAGLRADPYTGQDLHFVRGGSVGVDIDHVVALGDAWATGAQYWPVAERIALANDPANLLAVDASANRQKGDADAASWLPPQKSYRCAYVARQVAVKAKYGMWVTTAERDAMARVLTTCPDQAAPAVGVLVPAAPGLGVVPITSTTPGPSTPAASTGTSDPRFATCAQARAHGYGPYTRADPQYSWYRDADQDGTVCEG